jgi:hypothetical protein
MTVLIITRSDDNVSPARVAAAVEARGVRAYRLDTDRFPTDLRVSIHDAAGEGARHAAAASCGPAARCHPRRRSPPIYYRRFNVGARIPTDLEPPAPRAVGRGEPARAPRPAGRRSSASGAFALDRLDVVRRAEHKPLQLALARRHGLDTPRTLVTNDPDGRPRLRGALSPRASSPR